MGLVSFRSECILYAGCFSMAVAIKSDTLLRCGVHLIALGILIALCNPENIFFRYSVPKVWVSPAYAVDVLLLLCTTLAGDICRMSRQLLRQLKAPTRCLSATPVKHTKVIMLPIKP
jgi:hypothetical protein